MRRFLKYPALNAVCISLFSGFYAFVFIVTSGRQEFTEFLYYTGQGGDLARFPGFWLWWSRFLAQGNQQYIAFILLGLTALVVILLFTRRRPYDEYHVDRLITCLVGAIVLTMIAIALLYRKFGGFTSAAARIIPMGFIGKLAARISYKI